MLKALDSTQLTRLLCDCSACFVAFPCCWQSQTLLNVLALCTWLMILAGRGGTCELMIGCIAKATSNTLHVDETEMDDVRWVSRDQLQTAVQDSQRMDTPYHGQPLSHARLCMHAHSGSAERLSYLVKIIVLAWCYACRY